MKPKDKKKSFFGKSDNLKKIAKISTGPSDKVTKKFGMK